MLLVTDFLLFSAACALAVKFQTKSTIIGLVDHVEAQVNPNAIFVSKRQEGNPVLKHIRNVRWQFADIIPDYQLGQNACAVFLSLRCAHT